MKARTFDGSLEAPVFTVTILSGQTQSSAVNIDGFTLAGFYTPSAFTGTTMTFQVAPTADGTYVNARDGEGSSSADISLAVAASRYTPFKNLALTAGWQFIKFTSGSAEAADRTITLAVRPVS